MRHIRVSTDKFTQETAVYLNNMQLLFQSGGRPISLKVDIFRIVHPRPSPVGLLFESWVREWVFLRCYHLDMLIDNQPLPVKTRRDPGKIQGNYLHEYITAQIPFPTMRRIAAAQIVHGRLCNTEFTFSPEQMGMLREFVAKASQ